MVSGSIAKPHPVGQRHQSREVLVLVRDPRVATARRQTLACARPRVIGEGYRRGLSASASGEGHLRAHLPIASKAWWVPTSDIWQRASYVLPGTAWAAGKAWWVPMRVLVTMRASSSRMPIKSRCEPIF